MISRLRRSITTFDQQISYRPDPRNATGAFCKTCLRATDSENMVEEKRGDVNYIKVLVKCHGAEQLETFLFASRDWDETDIKRAMRGVTWFDPHSHIETSGIPNQGVVNDPEDEVA